MIETNYQDEGKFNDIASSDLASYLFSLAERQKNADLAINTILDAIGRMFNLDSITIKELVENRKAIRCTYEWSKDHNSYIIGLERRFFQTDEEICRERFGDSNSGYYIFHKVGDVPAPFHLCKAEKVVTLLDIPIYKDKEYLGSINLTDYYTDREWQSEDISALQNVSKMLGSYIFGLRVHKENQDAMRSLVYNDSLTGLPNYDVFLSKVRRCLSVDDGMAIALISADVVNFKYINEKYGYEVGNDLLKHFVEVFYDSFNQIIGCCREYSDNFIYALKVIDDTDPEAVRFKVDRFVHSLAERIQSIYPSFNVSINSGISILYKPLGNLDATITEANAARKQAKKMTGHESSRSCIYHDKMINEQRKELDLVLSVDSAISNHEFKVYLQPKYNCDGSQIVGAEALIRWQKPDGSFIYPDQFIPAFEHNGCIIKTDYFVYGWVFSYLRNRLNNGLPCVPISMNVSRYHLLSRAFLSHVEYLQSLYQIPPELLEFEITENMYMDNFPAATFTLEQLKKMGISLSMDDFGSQFSSIEILTRFPIDTIKLDKVFMKEKLETLDKILITSIIDMARRLNIKVLCEGVETEEQRAFLEDVSCDAIQGYIFSKPVNADTFSALLNSTC